MVQIEESNAYGKIDVNRIAHFETVNDVTLPADYKAFLIEHNGGRPVPAIVQAVKSDVQWIYGMVDEPPFASVFHKIDVYHNRIPSWYLPIANDSGGNLYIMSLWHENHGLIAFWRHEEETSGDASQYFDNMTEVADSFTAFLAQLKDAV